MPTEIKKVALALVGVWTLFADPRREYQGHIGSSLREPRRGTSLGAP